MVKELDKPHISGKIKLVRFHLFGERGITMATVLLVDDNEDVRKTTASIFLLSHTVIQAVDGQDGMEKIGSNADTIDIVVTDFSMPRLNGLELASWVKKNHPEIPVILISSEERSNFAPADAFVLKDFSDDNKGLYLLQDLIATLLP